MSHHISAVVLHGPFDLRRAAEFDLRPTNLADSLTLFPLHWTHCDYWMQKLSMPGEVAAVPLLNLRIVHHIVHEITANIAPTSLFAIIETDYFGGNGTQSASAYRGKEELMPGTRATKGPINAALRILGVVAQKPRDEFDTVGLGGIRHWDDLFEAYQN
jgi:hypothetical protein